MEQVEWSPYSKTPLLEPINIKVEPGEFLAIVGPNGSGKTSLLRCLYRFHKPSSGRVLLDNQNLWKLTPRQSAQRIATVLQSTENDFALSVFDMVEIGLTPKSTSWRRSENDRERVRQVLAWLDLSHLEYRSCSELSGGERQRVMIARALVQEPDVLILDEPTNHLDIRHQLDMLELLVTLPCTIIVSLHDLSLASTYADRVLVMNDGKMNAYDSPDNVFTEERIKQVFQVDTLIDKHPINERPRFSYYLQN